MPIPQPPPRAFFGNLFDLDLATPIQSMMRLRERYGPIFRLQMPTEDLVIVSSRALVAELSDETRFDKKVHGPLSFVRDFAGDGLITAHTREANWQRAHRILGPALGPRVLRTMFPAMLDLVEQLTLKWERQGPRKIVNVSDDLTRLTVDTIALCGFGHRLNSFYDPRLHPFVSAMFRGLTEASARVRRPGFVNSWLLTRRARYRRDIRTMRTLAEEILRERREALAHPTGADLPEDLLSLMLSAQDPVTGERLDDENICHQLVTFLIAGHETTSGLLAFALHELLAAPEAMKRVRAQLDEVLGSRTPTYDDLALLTEVENVLYETLRLWPTAPAFALQAKAPREVIGGGFEVRRDQTVLVLLPALHRDPAVWEQEEKFLPQRMRREARAASPPHAWKPFGNGQRSCIGSAFALQEATLALAMVLQRFDLVDQRPAPARRNPEIVESLTLKPAHFEVKVRQRADRPRMPAKIERAPPPAPAISPPPLHVYYGSQTGTAKGYAEELAARARAAGGEASCAPLSELDLRAPPRGVLTVVCASYHGQPPANARGLVDRLPDLPLGSLTGLRFAVFGCGSTDYPKTYQAIPARIDEALARAGATRLLPRGEADSRLGGALAFRAWAEAFGTASLAAPLPTCPYAPRARVAATREGARA